MNTNPSLALCPLCGRDSSCRAFRVDTSGPCWCDSLDLAACRPSVEQALAALDPQIAPGCVCEECLRKHGAVDKIQ